MHDVTILAPLNVTPVTPSPVPAKLGRYHDIIEYRDINLETSSISVQLGFNQNIDILRYIAISI